MTQTQYFALQGGLDIVTPAIQTPAGRAIAGLNYEPHPRGYQRVDGFERLDGRPKPSNASYWILAFDAGSTDIVEDDIVTGATSGATARAVIDAVVETGDWGMGDAAGYLVLMALEGEFQEDEDLEIASSAVATANGEAQERSALTDENDSAWFQAAIEKARDDIEAVPGSGPVRGVWLYRGDVYAFRDNAGGTAGVMHKATASGWDDVDLGREIAFTDGTGAVEPIGDLESEPTFIPDVVNLVDAINHGAVVSEEAGVPGMTFEAGDYLDTGTMLAEAGHLFAETTGENEDALPWSIKAAFRVDGGGGTNRPVLMRGGGLGSNTTFGLWVDTSGNLQCRLRGGTITQLLASANDGAWHTAIITWDTDQAIGYVDGGSPTIINVGAATLQASGHEHNLGIGRLPHGSAGAGSFVGQISDVGVWAQALSAADVQDVHDRRLKGTESRLLHYWPMSVVEGEFEAGQTVTGGTSSATAEIKRVVVESGDFSTHNAAGRLIIGTVTDGPFEDEENLTTNTAAAEAEGAESAITLPAGGRYDFRNHNFFGSSDLQRMYGINGEGRGFEWDGSVFVPIETGMDDDRPIRVEVHRNHLFFAFRGGSLQHSSIGNPYQWQVLTGAGEIGIGEEITDLLGSVSGILSIFGRNRVDILLGDDAANWDRRPLSDSSGAVAWTAQSIGAPIYLDNSGLRSLETTEQFGDFRIGSITRLVEPLFRAKRRIGVSAVGSLRVRTKDQYRLFWSDGSGLTVYFGRKSPEILPFDLGFAITSSASGKDEEGEEVLLLGSEEGMVYELDTGTSFDGEEVDGFLRLPFNHVGSPAQRKRWQKATLEVDSGPNTELGMTAEFGYADPDQPPGQEQSFSVKGSGGFWDEMSWDNFYWSSPVEGQAEAHIDGLGRNLSITVVSAATYEEAHVLHGLVLYFTYRGIVR